MYNSQRSQNLPKCSKLPVFLPTKIDFCLYLVELFYLKMIFSWWSVCIDSKMTLHRLSYVNWRICHLFDWEKLIFHDISKDFKRFWTIFDIFFINNWFRYPQINLFHADDYINRDKFYVTTLFYELDQFGTFWPFLTTFGIESITRWRKIFSTRLISWKPI